MIETGRHRHLVAMAALLGMIVLGGGCDRGNDAEGSTRDNTTVPPAADGRADTPSSTAGETGEARPATKSGTIALEGMPHTIQLRLVEDGLPFSTYVPENDFIQEQASSDEGAGIRFLARFGGVLNRNANLSIFVPNENFSQEQMEELIAGEHGVAAGNGWTTERLTDPSSYCPWAVSAYRIAGGEDIIGHACIGMHEGKAFYVIAVYPREYAEGFGPRASLILSEFRWKDTGTGLEKS